MIQQVKSGRLVSRLIGFCTLFYFRSSFSSENSTTFKTRLAELDERLRVSADRISEDTDGINTSLDHMKEERYTILKCLDMCAEHPVLLKEHVQTYSKTSPPLIIRIN
jgi:hypothetical protein